MIRQICRFLSSISMIKCLMKVVDVLNEKSVRLVLILVAEFVALAGFTVLVSFVFGVKNTVTSTMIIAPFAFMFGLISPLIFITQFHHKIFYKHFGIVLLVFSAYNLFVDFTVSLGIYQSLNYIGYILSILSFIGLIIYAIKLGDLGRTIIFISLIIISKLYLNQILLDYFLRLSLNSFQSLMFRVGIPVILSFSIFIYKLYIVVYECKVQKDEVTELL